jgi:hypothetical protein
MSCNCRDGASSSPPALTPAWQYTRPEVVQQALDLLECSFGETDALASPAIVRDYLRLLLADRPHEVFAVVFLDAQHRVIEVIEMFRGTLTQTSVYPREVVIEALARNAAAVILTHNHPFHMSHLLQTMAYVGQTPWHQLGNQLPKPNNPSTSGPVRPAWTGPSARRRCATWTDQAGALRLDHDLRRPEGAVPQRYQGPLSVVSGRYQVVQPKEVLEFYRDLTEVSGYELETAGVLKEGASSGRWPAPASPRRSRATMWSTAICCWPPPATARWPPPPPPPRSAWSATTPSRLP